MSKNKNNETERKAKVVVAGLGIDLNAQDDLKKKVNGTKII